MKKIDKFKAVVCYLLSLVSIGFVILIMVMKVQYPFLYNAEISRYSHEFLLDKNLVRAIINVESGYNELAVSSKGAVGLMQIMPTTAEWIADELFLDDFSDTMLFNPEINIKMGCFYLNYLFNKYESIDLVLYAYNAGEGRLGEVLNGEKINLESPQIINESLSYIKNVKSNMKCYDKILSKD